MYDDLLEFMDEFVYPNEEVYEAQLRLNKHVIPPVVEDLKKKAKERGLWNFFNPDLSPDGKGISQREYAALAEITGRNLWCAEVFNTQFPDTGNMETLHKFGTEAQKRAHLTGLLDGTSRSSFVMTEPQVASSDATQIATTIKREGDEYVINGQKIWITGIADKRCDVLLVLGRTDFDPNSKNTPHKKHSVVIVPRYTKGVIVNQPMMLYGYDDLPHGHCEIELVDVRVPVSNLLYKEGEGFSIAQTRLGPGRLHHCMRCVGLAQRALDLTVERMNSRSVKGVMFRDLGALRAELAESAMDVEQSRLLVLHAASYLDTYGAKEARYLISMCKVRVLDQCLKVIDKAMQVFGGLGMSQHVPLSAFYVRVDSARRMDGPSATHRETVAKSYFSAKL